MFTVTTLFDECLYCLLAPKHAQTITLSANVVLWLLQVKLCQVNLLLAALCSRLALVLSAFYQALPSQRLCEQVCQQGAALAQYAALQHSTAACNRLAVLFACC